MAEYLDIDPTVVRILWILSAFLGGFTIVLYIILAFVIPLEPATSAAPGWWQAPGSGRPAGPAWGVPPAQAAGGPDPSAGSSTAGSPDPAASSSSVDPADPADPAQGTTGTAEPAPAWTSPNPSWAVPDHRTDGRRGGRTGLFFGVLLVVFGTIALANTMVPGWAVGGLLWPAFVVAVGAALLVGAIRRTSDNR